MELDSDQIHVDYELALRLQVENIPPEFTEEPFLFHEVLHSFFRPDHVCDVLDNSQTAHQQVCENRIYHAHHAQAALASTSSSVVAVPSLVHSPELNDCGISVSGEPFKLFFKGVLATLDEGLHSTVEAILVAPAGAFVREIASSLRPEISGKLVADYRALRNGLAAALELNILHVQAIGDSKLLEDQITGAVKIVSSTVRKLASEVIDQINQFEIFELVILPKMERYSTAWDLATEFSSQSNKSAEIARGKMIVTEPSTDVCTIWPGEDQTSGSNKMMAMEATSTGCGSAFADKEKLQQNSSRDLNMMVLEPATNQRCSICLEGKLHKDMLTMNGCLHTFCLRCLVQHTESELQIGRIPRCPEPSCRMEMEVEQCGQFLARELFVLFTTFLAEASIPEDERLYCPYADCSELFLKMSCSPSSSSSQTIMKSNETTCVSCNRSFCLTCVVPSHAPLSCAEYEELAPEDKQQHDLQLLELAASLQWKRCARCRMIIQRTEGCSHMTCRCGYQFCYICQEIWKTCNCRQ